MTQLNFNLDMDKLTEEILGSDLNATTKGYLMRIWKPSGMRMSKPRIVNAARIVRICGFSLSTLPGPPRNTGSGR